MQIIYFITYFTLINTKITTKTLSKVENVIIFFFFTITQKKNTQIVNLLHSRYGYLCGNKENCRNLIILRRVERQLGWLFLFLNTFIIYRIKNRFELFKYKYTWSYIFTLDIILRLDKYLNSKSMQIVFKNDNIVTYMLVGCFAII